MASALARYAFLSAKLKARLSKELPPGLINRLISSRSLPEAIMLLRDTPYAPIERMYADTGDLRAGEALIQARELELYTELFRYLKDPELSFVRALSLRFELEKVKHALRLWFDAAVRKRNIDGKSGYIYRPTIVHYFDVDEVIRAPDIESVVKAFGRSPYAELARRELPAAVSGRSLFAFELCLDRYYYDEAFAAAARLDGRDRGIAERALGVDVDMRNLSWLMRFKAGPEAAQGFILSAILPRGRAIDSRSLAAAAEVRQGSAEFGSAGASSAAATAALDLLAKYYGRFASLLGRGGDPAARLSLMEGALRQIALAEADRSLAGFPFSIGVVLAYFTKRREELRSVMTILYAKNYSLPEERIRSAL
jgi:V/A-type H+-transporting ATPase subunit C